VAAETWLGPLGVLELDDTDALDRLFANTEKACGYLGDDVIVIRLHAFHVTAFTGAGKGIESDGGPRL